MRIATLVTLACITATVLPLTAPAATVPLSRPLRLLVPYVPGGGTDTVARLIAPALSEAVGQQVVVDNRPGGSSTIATQLVARAAPDGQTIGISDAAFFTNPSLLEKLPYDTLRDLVPIAIVSSGSMLLVVHPTLPAKSVKDLIALAKLQPGKLTYGTAGNGTATHLAGEQLRWVAQIDIQHIPYKGAGQSITELLGGHISMAFTSPSTAKTHVASGRLRALAITSVKRNAAIADVETFTEAGFARVDTQTLTPLFAPAGISPKYVSGLNAAVMRATGMGELRERFQSLGYDVETNTPAEAAARVRTELEKWRTIIRNSGARAHGA
jgi:tripartite-type tricarboxylate transporter receptor subunit TctC